MLSMKSLSARPKSAGGMICGATKIVTFVDYWHALLHFPGGAQISRSSHTEGKYFPNQAAPRLNVAYFILVRADEANALELRNSSA